MERSNSGKTGKIEMKFHRAAFLEFVGGQIIINCLIKEEFTVAYLASWANNELCALQVDGIYPDQDY